MLRLVYALLVGLAGAGIVHIAVLLMLPRFSERDAWSNLAESADFYKAVRVDDSDGTAAVVKAADPLFHAAACRIDLRHGPAHLRAPGNVPFWSASIYNRAGQNIYSFNDRATDHGALDFVVLTPAQMIEVRKAVPPDYSRAIFVQVPLDEGIVLVRSFSPDPTWQEATSEFLSRLSCTRS